MRIVAIFCCLWFLVGSFYAAGQEQEQEQDSAQESPGDQLERTNWFIYFYEQNQDHTFQRLIPFYSYASYPNRAQDQFWFWPLLAGYEVARNPAPTTFPFGIDFNWYTLPFLTLAKQQISPTEDVYTSTLVSFLFFTYFQERQVKDQYLSYRWYSLPLMSYYQSETLWEKDLETGNTTWGSPLFSWRDVRLVHQNQVYPAYEWAFNPLSLVFGQDFLQFVRHARWGRDHLWEMFTLDSFAVFSISTTFAQYPGVQYQRFVQFETDRDKAIGELFAVPLAFPKTRLAILAPFFVFETSPSGLFSWQFLPFFSYVSRGEETAFYLLPLFLEFGTRGVRFSPQPKWFPLVYYDEMYGSWDILWPLFRYVDNPALPAQRLSMRFIFDYERRRDAQDRSYVDLSVLERIVLSYQHDDAKVHWQLLPGGLLFEYYADPAQYQWRVLGFGYLETTDTRYLQILFFRISLGGKT